MTCTSVKVWRQDEVWTRTVNSRIPADLVRNAHSLAPSRSSIVSLLEREGVSLVGDCEMAGSGHPVALEAQRWSVGDLRLRVCGHVGSSANLPPPHHGL